MLKNRLILFLLLMQMPALYDDGGFLPPVDYSGSNLSEPSQRAVVVHARNREHLYLFVDYHGDAEKFAWIIPCPTNPRVRQSSLDVLKETARYYHRLEVHAWTEEVRGLAKSGGGAGSQSSSEHSMIVHDIQTLGPYEVATIFAENEDGLAVWLNANGYSVSERATPILKTYIAEKWCFAAVRIRTKPGAIQTLPPLALDFETRYPVYPIRISALNSGTTDTGMKDIGPTAFESCPRKSIYINNNGQILGWWNKPLVETQTRGILLNPTVEKSNESRSTR